MVIDRLQIEISNLWICFNHGFSCLLQKVTIIDIFTHFCLIICLYHYFLFRAKNIQNQTFTESFKYWTYIKEQQTETWVVGHTPHEAALARTTDTLWLNPKFFVAQIQIPIPNK